MIEWKLKKLLRDIKKKDPQKRLEAIEQLNLYKQQSDLEIQLETLGDIIKVAASNFPEPVDDWDNPSYYLIDFVADYPNKVTIKAFIKHFNNLHIHAQYRAIQALLATEDENVFYFLEHKIIELIEADRLEIPIEDISTYPLLAKAIVEKTIHKLNSPDHKFSFYELLLAINASGYGKNFKSDIVLPTLLEDYQREKEDFLPYNADYSLKFVYTAWKESYYFTRNRMILYIRLMAFYFNAEVEKELNIAVTFQDPFLKARALSICLEKNLPYDDEQLIECASNIESAEFTYRMLIEKNLGHLYPYPNDVQFYLAKTRLFFALVNQESEEPIYPENLEVIDDVEVNTYHGLTAKFYLMTFENFGKVYVGWAGGFIETEENTIEVLNGTHSDFIEFDTMSVAEHKQNFLQQDMESRENYKDEVHYESSPKLSNLTYFFMFPIAAKWLQILLGSDTSLLATIAATLILTIYILYSTSMNKTRKVQISGQQLIKQDGSQFLTIPMNEIKSVQRNKKSIVIYNQNDQIVMEIPIRWVNYDVFAFQLKQHTAFLLNPPFIQLEN